MSVLGQLHQITIYNLYTGEESYVSWLDVATIILLLTLYLESNGRVLRRKWFYHRSIIKTYLTHVEKWSTLRGA